MNEQTIQEQYRQIVTLLQQKRLKEAQAQLEAFLWQCEEGSLHRRLEQAQTSYHYLLQYMQQGVEDPEREKLHKRLLAETWEIADQTYTILSDKISSHFYHSLRRQQKNASGRSLAEGRKILESFPDDWAVCQLMPENRQSADSLLHRHEEAAEKLFLGTWANCAWSTEEAREMQAFLQPGQTTTTADLSLLASAVMLSLLECFDAHKFSWLLDAYTHADTHVSQRALTGMAIVLQKYPNRIPLYPELTARLSILNEDGHLGKQLNRIYIQLLRSKETEKIDKKMREEILPEMMKSVRGMKFGFEDPADDNDRNPDWEQTIHQMGLEDKLREMNELQMEGSDVYMGTFSQLKRYPFFQQPVNWFRTFDPQHSSVIHLFRQEQTQDNPLLKLILKSGFFCDSDKYSLCFMMGFLPESQRTLMLNQLTSQDINSMLDRSDTATWQKYATRPEVISNQYIHDLYRFFKLNRLRNEIYNVFEEEETALHRIPALADILCRPELLKEVADFHFNKEHHAEALEIYQTLVANHQADANIFQKAGFCLQKEKRYKEAIEAYRKADALKPDHVWTIRHLATCHRLSRDFATALDYYKRVEAMQPENSRVIFFIGTCLAEEERYDEALQYFFKLDFMETNCIKAWRAIGWCSFASGKYAQAMKYYEKVMDNAPVAADYLNAGHVAWVMKDLEKTAKLYGKAVTTSGSKTAFLEMFEKDRETLLKKGIDEKDIPLVLDLV